MAVEPYLFDLKERAYVQHERGTVVRIVARRCKPPSSDSEKQDQDHQEELDDVQHLTEDDLANFNPFYKIHVHLINGM